MYVMEFRSKLDLTQLRWHARAFSRSIKIDYSSSRVAEGDIVCYRAGILNPHAHTAIASLSKFVARYDLPVHPVASPASTHLKFPDKIGPEGDVYSRLAVEFKLPRPFVKELCFFIMYGANRDDIESRCRQHLINILTDGNT